MSDTLLTRVDGIIGGALAHHEAGLGGEENPEFGFGDLEIALRLCWNEMSTASRRVVLSNWHVQQIIKWNK